MIKSYYFSLAMLTASCLAATVLAQSSAEHHEDEVVGPYVAQDILDALRPASGANGETQSPLETHAADGDVLIDSDKDVIKDIKTLLPATSENSQTTPQASSDFTPKIKLNSNEPEVSKEALPAADNLLIVDQNSEEKNEIKKVRVVDFPEVIQVRASINYEGFTKPITTCRAQIINITKKSKGSLFEIEGDVHLSNKNALPVNSDNTDIAKISFSAPIPYGPSSCTKHNLETREYPLTELIELFADPDFVFKVEPDNTLFIAYINLQSEKVHRSIARWRETLDVTNNIYKTGVSSKMWSDGILLGLDKEGVVSPIFMPLGNFPADLMTNTNVLDLATDFSTQPRSASVKSPPIIQIKDTYNSKENVAILFISDEYPSCRAAIKSIMTSKLTTNPKIFFVLPVSDTSTKTGAKKLSGTHKLLRCDHKQTEPLYKNIVAFDLFERADNLDWKDTMKQAEKQAEKMEFSREKF